jgi:capsular exopolysaccharide synthesis family protein
VSSRPVLWSQRGLLATMTLLGLVGGAAFGMVALRPAYESAAQVLVHPITAGTSKSPEPISSAAMGTERELVFADGVAVLVQQRTGWPDSPADLRRRLHVSIEGGTQTMSIRYRADNPARAQMGAQIFAESYLAYRADLAEATRDGSRQSLEAALRDVSDRMAGLRNSLASTPAGAQAASETVLEEAAPFQARLAEVTAIAPHAAGTVVSPARVPTSLSGAGPVGAGGAGALLGLLAGLSLAFFRKATDLRIRGRADLEAELGAPVLGAVPRTRREGQAETALVTLTVPDGPAAEAYRGVRARILAMSDRWGLKTLMVAGPMPGSATTAIAANLAVSMASTGRRVTLVSADLRSPDLHHYFGLENDRGLSNVLVGELAPSDVVHEPPGLATLQVLPAGPAIGEPTDLLESGSMRVVLEERSEVADFVVIEAPPALEAAEALTLAPMVDGIVVVADAQQATREDVAEVGDQFRLVGGNVVGAVLCNLR